MRGRIENNYGELVDSQNEGRILGYLPMKDNKISDHAYCSVQKNGITALNQVKSLVNTVKRIHIWAR